MSLKRDIPVRLEKRGLDSKGDSQEGTRWA